MRQFQTACGGDGPGWVDEHDVCLLLTHQGPEWLDAPSRNEVYPEPVVGVPVSHNLESQRLQYAMRDRLERFGWTDIDVVDDDLGRSAAGLITRRGFERMVADVCLGKVGAVAAREVSRFARNSRERQHLVEMCRVVDTVLIDQDTVCMPRA